jgi:LPXTG-motif cell wall-anchored protein
VSPASATALAEQTKARPTDDSLAFTGTGAVAATAFGVALIATGGALLPRRKRAAPR